MAYLAKAANNEDPRSNLDAQRQLRTFDELCEACIENQAKKKKKTWKDDHSYLKRYVFSKLSGRLAVSFVTATSRPSTRNPVSNISTGRRISQRAAMCWREMYTSAKSWSHRVPTNQSVVMPINFGIPHRCTP